MNSFVPLCAFISGKYKCGAICQEYVYQNARQLFCLPTGNVRETQELSGLVNARHCGQE